jgi:hypothetical protein
MAHELVFIGPTGEPNVESSYGDIAFAMSNA